MNYFFKIFKLFLIRFTNKLHIKKYSKLLGFNYDEGIFGTSFQVYKKELGIGYEIINNLKEITFENPPKK